MSKKDQILALAKQGKSTHQIAREVYGLPKWAGSETVDRKAAYVRVVLRQRKGGPISKHDARYLMTKYGGATVKEARKRANRIRYADPKKYARHLQQCREWYARSRDANRLT